jgi:hypothetical protein
MLVRCPVRGWMCLSLCSVDLQVWKTKDTFQGIQLSTAPMTRIHFRKPFWIKSKSNYSPCVDTRLPQKLMTVHCQVDLGLLLSLSPCHSTKTSLAIAEV